MLQILAVYFQNLLVRAKDGCDFAYLLAVSFGHGFDPCGRFALLDGGHFHAFCLITNHSLCQLKNKYPMKMAASIPVKSAISPQLNACLVRVTLTLPKYTARI